MGKHYCKKLEQHMIRLEIQRKFLCLNLYKVCLNPIRPGFEPIHFTIKFWQNSKQFVCKEHFHTSNIDSVRGIRNLKEIHQNTLTQISEFV